MQCLNENDEGSKYGEFCKLGYKLCLEERCPDYKPREGQLEDA